MKLKKSYLLEGIIKRHPDGFGWLIPDDKDHPDIYIPSGKMGSALTNDRVAVWTHQKGRGRLQRSPVGFVRSILKRGQEFAIGPFESEGGQMLMRKHNLGHSFDVLLSNPEKISVKKGDYIKAKIRSYPKGSAPFKADLLENFGPISSLAGDDVKRIMAERNIPFDFSPEVLEELKKWPEELSEGDYAQRKDLRGQPFVTIDGTTAQDFDDAVFVKKYPQFFRLYVAIADVSHYVKEDSFLDKEAFERGNSSYFPGFCVPMLPEKLSHNLCSLKAGKDRLTLVQEMDFNFQGERIRSELYPSVIHSQKRLTYGQAQDIMDGLSSLKGEYLEALKEAQALTKILLKKHIKEQGLDLDIPETAVVVDDRGEPQDIIKEKRLFSHIMIEQFMLSANKAVSAFLEKRKIPLMYRIHEAPLAEKLKSLQGFSKALGYPSSLKTRESFVRFLTQHKGHSRVALIHKLVLRSLPQARYSSFNKGHYGLNFSSYTHFTSPIRRYCDLFIHRLIKQALAFAGEEGDSGQPFSKKLKGKSSAKAQKMFRDKEDSPSAQKKFKGEEGSSSSTKTQKKFKSEGGEKSFTLLSQKEIERKASYISEKEQNSVKAERRIKDIKIARFAKKYVGQEFSGYVSSVSSFGLFVALRLFPAEGLIRFQDLKGFWERDDLELSAVNKKSGYRIQFGDELKVLITASNTLTGKIDFKLLSHKGRKVRL